MTERLVDVMDARRLVIHTFPITIEGLEIPDSRYERKALEAAAYEKLVPDAELHSLTARMHTSRRGPLEPFGDDRDVLAQTKTSLDQSIRDRAYLLWEQEGRPEGQADEYWHRARKLHLQERAHSLWEQESRPDGRADEHMERTRHFEGLGPLDAPERTSP